MTNPLRELEGLGQSVWLDYLNREILQNGELQRLIDDDGVKGVTSNPSIFEKAIGQGHAYDDELAKLSGGEPNAIYERLAVADIRRAADILRPTYDRLGGADGFVSLEVSPFLAMDTQGTVAEARRLWREVDRPNLMIKVPGARPGVPAIRALIAEGININVTLLFGLDAYLEVADAHMGGLEERRRAGQDIAGVHGVASFFVSRIDTEIDKAIDTQLAHATGEDAATLKSLRGKVAIANAKNAYQHYLELVRGDRWRALADAGATPQRLLWASTGTKDPAYPDTLYPDALIGPDTIDTLPPSTMDAFRDHGAVRPTLTAEVEAARRVLADTERLGLDLRRVTDQLVIDGVRLFSEALAGLLRVISTKAAHVRGAA